MILPLLAACAPSTAPRPPAPREVIPLDRAALTTALFSPTDHVRVANFWATWCAPCRREMPVLASFGRAHPEVELIFVDLDLPKLRASTVEPFVSDQGLWGFTHYLLDDPDPMTALPAVVPGWPDQVPVTLVIAPDGTVRRTYDRALAEGELTVE